MHRYLLLILVIMFTSTSVVADEPAMKRVHDELVKSFPELKSATIKPSPVPELFSVEFGADVFYVTHDGKYLFMGNVVHLSSQNNITELRRTELRTQLLNDMGEDNMIVIGPEKPKRTLTVFTDVDCPYCAQFHLDIPALAKQGVKVRYLFFPGGGPGSESYQKAVAVWCAKDRAKAMGIAKARGKIDMKTCANPIDSHFQLGQSLNINGTPAIFLDDGKVLRGYLPAPRLLGLLGLGR